MGGLTSLAGNLTGGIIGTSDAEAAAQTSSGLSKEARDAILKELDSSWGQSSSWLTPYIDQGATALNNYRSMLGLAPDAPVFDNFNFDFSNYQNSDAYKFLMDQGTQAIMRSSAAGRRLGGGQTAIDLMQFGQGLASQEYGNEFARQLSSYTTNRQSQAMGYDAARGRWQDMLTGYGNLYNTDLTNRTNLATMRGNYADRRAGAYSNYAAEQSAAAMVPAYEKMGFINNLISGGATVAGGLGAGGFFNGSAAAAAV